MKKYLLLIVLFCSLLNISFAQSWSTTGNNGTNPSTNFLGTKDNQSLVFKTNNKERIRVSSLGKIGIGIIKPIQMLDVNGSINISNGSSFFIDNHKVMSVGLSNLNIFLGTGAGTLNITGVGNASAGNNALYSIATGNYNTAVGTAALFSSASANNNTAIGHTALYNNTTGFENTATGKEALYKNNTGYSNTATGPYSLYSNITGSYNSAVGWFALAGTTDSWLNTAIGISAGGAFNNGDNNTFIGADARALLNGVNNSTALGYATYIDASNQVRIGNSNVTSIGGFVGWSNISDERVKKNVKTNVPGLAFINKLKAVTYNLDLDAADRIMQTSIVKSKNEKSMMRQPSQSEISAHNAKQQIVYSGFMAQDVEKAAKELNYDFSGVDAAKNDKGLYALRYAEFVVPLVKAVQELSKVNDEKDATISEMKSEILNLKSEMEELKSMILSGSRSSASSNLQCQTLNAKQSNVSLEQNIPNPFNQTTRINYTLPQQFSSAKIIITDKSGKTVKEINLPANKQSVSQNKGSVTVDAAALSSGIYQYSLYAGGKLIDTKQMEHLK